MRAKSLVAMLALAVTCAAESRAAESREELFKRMQAFQEAVQAGVKLSGEKKYEEALGKFAEAEKLIPNRPTVQYNVACVLALTGKKDEALDALERAIKAGFVDAAHMESDTDLDGVRATERFKELVAVARKRAEGNPPLVHVPKGYDEKGEKAYPLFVCLHGAGGRPEGFFGVLKGVLGEDRYFVLAPYGSAVAGPGYTWTGADMGKLAAEVGQLRKKYRIGKVVLFGFSAGAHFGYAVVLKQRSLFDGFIPMAGSISNARAAKLVTDEDLKSAKGLAVYAIQGTEDDVVPAAAAEQSVELLKKHGAVTTMFKHPAGHAPPKEFGKSLLEALRWIDEQGKGAGGT